MGFWAIFDWLTLAIVAGCLAYVLVRRPPAALWPSLPLALFFYLVRMVGDLGTTRDLEHPHLWLTVLHTGGVWVPTATWILGVRFAEAYGRPFSWGRRRWVYAPIPVALLLWLGIVTNPWHGAFLTPVPGSRSEYGWIAVLMGGTAYLTTLGIVVLYAWLRRHHHSWLVRRKATLMILAYAAPPVFNLAYVLPPESPPFDLSVVGVSWSVVLVMMGVYRSGLFNPLPVALPDVISNEADAVVLLDPDGYPFFANGAARRLFPPATWVPDAPFQVHLERALAPVRRPQASANGDAFSPRDTPLYRLREEEDSYFRVERSPIRSTKGLEVGTCVRLHDVSAFLEAQASLRMSEERFRALADNAHDLVAELDADARVLYANPAHTEVFGIPASRFHRRHSTEHVIPQDRGRLVEIFRKTMATGRVSGEIVTAIDADGGQRALEVTARAFLTPSGEPRAVVISRDVSERDSPPATQQLQRERLDTARHFAEGAGALLNNALVPILGNTSLLLEELSPRELTAEMLTEVEAAAMRAADLAAKLLACAGRALQDPARVDLSSVVRATRHRLEHPERGARLQLELADDLPPVELDREGVQRALRELVDNAFAALGDRPGEVRVRTALVENRDDDPDAGTRCFRVLERHAPCCVVLEVRDTGPGIAGERHGRIFEPFHGSGPGMGLGLSVVLGTARAHGAGLELESAPGAGTRVRLLFPA